MTIIWKWVSSPQGNPPPFPSRLCDNETQQREILTFTSPTEWLSTVMSRNATARNTYATHANVNCINTTITNTASANTTSTNTTSANITSTNTTSTNRSITKTTDRRWTVIIWKISPLPFVQIRFSSIAFLHHWLKYNFIFLSLASMLSAHFPAFGPFQFQFTQTFPCGRFFSSPTIKDITQAKKACDEQNIWATYI